MEMNLSFILLLDLAGIIHTSHFNEEHVLLLTHVFRQNFTSTSPTESLKSENVIANVALAEGSNAPRRSEVARTKSHSF